jgi:hypothetical protein
MKTYLRLAALAASLAIAGTAHAGKTLTSGGIPTGVNNTAACYFRNVGETPLMIQAQGLINFTRNFTSPHFQNCNDAPLPPGRTCILLWHDIDDATTFACTVDVIGNYKNLRAAAELRQQLTGGGLKVVASSELR